jgi:hypothetical protein
VPQSTTLIKLKISLVLTITTRRSHLDFGLNGIGFFGFDLCGSGFMPAHAGAPPHSRPDAGAPPDSGEARVEIYCAAKPGLLLSTVSKLDTLGLDIQQVVVSCFSDFGMHASCSEVQYLCYACSSIHTAQYLFLQIF